MASLTVAEQNLQHGAVFKAALLAQANNAQAQGGLTARVTSATLLSPNSASVHFDLLAAGKPLLSDTPGNAAREDGRWKVAAKTFCQLIGLTGHPAGAVQRPEDHGLAALSCQTRLVQQPIRRGPALGTVLAVLALTFLDTTIVSVTLGNIQYDLGAGVIPLQWVVNAYSLVFASLMLIAGTLSDRFGRRTLMVAGIAVFCAGSLLCALAPGVGWLIAGRAVMGVGAAASEPGTLVGHPPALRRSRRTGARARCVGGGLGAVAGARAGARRRSRQRRLVARRVLVQPRPRARAPRRDDAARPEQFRSATGAARRRRVPARRGRARCADLRGHLG